MKIDGYFVNCIVIIKFKNKMKKCNPVPLSKKQLLCLTVVFMFSFQIFSQTDRIEAKKVALKNKVEMAEVKVKAAERKLAVADSIYNTGEENIYLAETKFDSIDLVMREEEKEYNTEIKSLYKQSRSKDEETAKKAEVDMKTLEKEYIANRKLQEAEIKTFAKQSTKGKSNMDKGKDMKKAASARLKDAQKALDLARENYDDFVASLETVNPEDE